MIIVPTSSKRKRRIIVHGSVTRYGPQSVVVQRKWSNTIWTIISNAMSYFIWSDGVSKLSKWDDAKKSLSRAKD